MAAKTARPGRTLIGFFTALAIAFGLVALTGTWKPELGLDLQGGTSIRLIAEGEPTPESLEEARKIIDQRVNGSGVAEAEVTVQGNRFIVVEIPGDSRADLEETVKRQAQLRFRLVACTDRVGAPCGAAATPEIPTEAEPGEGVVAPTETPTPEATAEVTPSDAARRRRRRLRQRQPGPGELLRRDPVRPRPTTTPDRGPDRQPRPSTRWGRGRRATSRSRRPRAARTSATR